MARSPFPRVPLTGNCDAAGAATITLTGPASFWAAVYLAIQVSAGSPSYTIQQGTALPLVFGGGTQTQLGPILLAPGEVVQIVVKNANANATVTGQAIGWQADDPSELPATLVSQGSINIGSINAGVVMPVSGNVGITGSVTATITAGNVTIQNASISVINLAGTQLAGVGNYPGGTLIDPRGIRSLAPTDVSLVGFRATDGWGVNAPAGDAQAVGGLTATTSKRWKLAYAVLTMACYVVSPSSIRYAQLYDGGFGIGSILSERVIVPQAVVGWSETWIIPASGFASSFGNALTVGFNGGLIGYVQSVSIAGWLDST